MKPFKPLFLKTYGKQKRKVSAWISPETHKRAFDSTDCDDVSALETARTKRARKTGLVPAPVLVKGRRRKVSFTSDSEEENFVAQPNKRSIKTVTCSKKNSTKVGRQKDRAAKKKAMHCLTEKSYDEGNMSNDENINTLPHTNLVPAQPTATTRRTRLMSAPDIAKNQCHKISLNSESEEERIVVKSRKRTDKTGTISVTKLRRKSIDKGAESNTYLQSAGRFVTRRRRPASTRLTKAIANILSSSDDFTSESLAPKRKFQPSRRRKVPAVFGLSGSENSANDAGVSSFTTNIFREISLNESVNRSLEARLRKPIFCSTPSAASFDKSRQCKVPHPCDQLTTPPFAPGGGADALFGSPEDHPLSLKSGSGSASFHEQSSEKEQSLHHIEEKSLDVVEVDQDKSTNGTAINNSGSMVILSSDSVSSSHFVSAAGGPKWLVEVLKERCLSRVCTVHLERLVLAQILNQTPYSSCLDHSSLQSVQDVVEQSQSGIISETSDRSLEIFTAPPASNSNSAAHQKSCECSAMEEASQRSQLVCLAHSTHHPNHTCEITTNSEVPAEDFDAIQFTEKLKAIRDECLSKKCVVLSQKLSLLHLQELAHQKDALSSFTTFSKDAIQLQNDMCSKETSQSRITTHEIQNVDSKEGQIEKSGNAALPSVLKEKCLTCAPVVEVQRLSLPELKEVLQRDNEMLKSSLDMSELTSDHAIKTVQLSESGSCENSSTRDDSKSRSPGSSESKGTSTSAGKRNSLKGPAKRKKASVGARRKKSPSADVSTTTRKACVSGMSVSRWKNKGGAFGSRAGPTGHAKAADCSISELISTKSKQPKELLTTPMKFSTPLRVSRLNLSSLLNDLTPRTHTWSRLKAALSIHRKGIVQLTLSESGTPRRWTGADVSQDLFATPFRTPLPRHLRSQLLSQQSLVEEVELSDAEKVFAECGQERPLAWEECILPHRAKRCVKIGEGTFGEVFSTTNASGEAVALKIIPVEGSEKVNGEDQKTFGEILHEIIISKELSSLKEKQQNQTHGFIGLNDLHCVQGCYPPDFLKAWDAFDRKKGSENDRPDFFEKDQLFIILEFEFGGADLENSNGKLASLGVAKSILHQVTAALAVAEQELHFEHRDLHWGNVLVKTTRQGKGSFSLNGTTHSLETKGVLVRIIDYSLSRLEIDELTVSCDISNDEELFMGQGDYQFEIYRLMRQENGNDWSSFHPHSNVLWIHYLCSKLLSMKYRSSAGQRAKDAREELTRFYDNVLQFSSATEVLRSCSLFQ